MNNDLISREALQDKFDNYCPHIECKKCRWYSLDNSFHKCSLIDNAPTVEAIPLKHHNKIKGIMDNEIKSLVDILDNERPQGKWLEICDIKSWQFTNEHYECDKCHYKGNKSNFCPNCGADMREGDSK